MQKYKRSGDRGSMKNRFYKKLYYLYFSLNPVFLQSLKDHAKDESEGKYTLEELISIYAANCHHSPQEYKYITMLENTNSISDQESFYDYISDIIYLLDQEGK